MEMDTVADVTAKDSTGWAREGMAAGARRHQAGA